MVRTKSARGLPSDGYFRNALGFPSVIIVLLKMGEDIQKNIRTVWLAFCKDEKRGKEKETVRYLWKASMELNKTPKSTHRGEAVPL